MSLKWCAYTGAVLALVVCVILLLLPQSQSSPWVRKVHRWWDGTLELQEEYHENGKLASRTRYGEDGRSLLSREKWNYQGELVEEGVRLSDGTFQERTFIHGQVASYLLWDGSRQVVLVSRSYFDDGSLEKEVKRSSDGRMVLEQRQYFRDGRLEEERLLTPHGDQSIVIYHSNGKLKLRVTASIGGKMEGDYYREDGSLRRRDRQDAESGLVVELIDSDGRVTLRWQEWAKPEAPILVDVYPKDRPPFRQTFVPDKKSQGMFDLKLVEVFDAATGTLSARLHVGAGKSVDKVERFDVAGKLRSVKELEDGRVRRQVNVDSAGVEVEVNPPEEEEIDKDLLKLYRVDEETGP